MVAVSEGIHYADGSFVSEAKTTATDGFGHAQLGGLAAMLASIVKKRPARRSAASSCACSSAARAPAPPRPTSKEAFMSGKLLSRDAVAGKTDKMVAFERATATATPARRSCLPLSEVANSEKKVPRSGSTPEGNGT